MPLSRYWPTRSEVNRCIKAEAESASDAVLLAVHQPMVMLRRDEGSGLESQVSEHEFLEAFLSDDLPQGTLLMPITGASGAGKSHLIRWLAAQLGRDSRARRMHVIRVPKSASLRDVVELVLEPLAGDERFSEVRGSLDRAIAQVSRFEAAVRFSGALEIALTGLKNRLFSTLRSNSQAGDTRDVRTRTNHAQRLPGFLNDPALRDHMTEHVLAPIIQRAVAGRRELGPGEEELLPQFRADDLRVPDELRGALGHASRPVQTYYQTGLNRADGAGFEEAASVLNEVVDEAVQQVFRLDQATGGVTLESIILRVRELLMKQDRELVLLVEDFAALSGIQQVLLNVSIQEAERDGKQVRSRMRTALALTDGYLVGRDTIATRAKQEWVIQPGGGTKDVIARTVELVGAYLNAARWGEDALKDQYSQSPRTEEADLTSWIRPFQDEDLAMEDSSQLQAFGISDRGVPLFPYNRSALEQLAERHLRAAGEVRFNPRRIINFILRDILLTGREDFEKGAFPPSEFQRAKARAGTASWLASLAMSDSERMRVESLLVYWGGNPADPQEASHLPKELFRAFRLKRPEGLGDGPGKPPFRPGPKPAPPPRPQPTPPPPPEIAEWRTRLDDWARGSELGQRDALKLRNVLLRNLEKAIPWNALRLAKRNLNLLLTIPNARGNEAPAAIRLPLAKDHQDPTGTLRQALLGALRLDESKGRLDYPEADEDSARLATLIERLLGELIPHLERQRHEEVLTLSWILRRQGRVLGLFPRARMPRFDLEVSAIRDPMDPVPQGQPDTDSRWQYLRRQATEQRRALQQALWDRIGCFQGDGKTPYGADPTLLEFNDEGEQPKTDFLTTNQREHLALLRPTRLAPAVRPVVEQLKEFSARLDGLLGPDRDKQKLILALGKLLEALEPVGVWPEGPTRPALKRNVEAFRNDDLKAQLEEVAPLLAVGDSFDPTADSTLERIGRIDLAVIDRGEAFLNQIENFVNAADRDLAVREGELAGIDPEKDAKTLAEILKQMDRDLSTISGEKSS